LNGGDVVVGGDFQSVDGVDANCIAKMSGGVWSPLGSGVDHFVYSLAVYGSDLIAGGSFNTAGGVEVNYVAAWSGTECRSGLGDQERLQHPVMTLQPSWTRLAGGYHRDRSRHASPNGTEALAPSWERNECQHKK
jgi:hypothetical protein